MLVQSILVLSSIATAFAAATSPDIAQKVASLRTAPSQLDRLNILSDDTDWKFSYLEQTSDANKYTDSPGSVVNGNAATWPAVIGNGMTMALLTLGPCAMLPPHYHPRAANYVMAFNGSTTTYMITENGARTVTETLGPFEATIFPAGSLHTMQNNGCETVYLSSVLNNEDQGTHNVANGLMFGLPADMVNAAFGNKDFDANATTDGIPKVDSSYHGAAMGSLVCQKKCGLA